MSSIAPAHETARLAALRRYHSLDTPAEDVFDAITAPHTVEALHASDARYRALFDNSPDAVLLSTAQGAILEANPAACRLFGYAADVFCTLTQQELIDQTEPRSAGLALRHPQGVQTAVTLIRRDGTRFTADMAEVVLHAQGGQEITALLIREMTGQVRAEMACTQHPPRLALDIRERQAVERMQEALSAVVSHELRTPLTSIRSALGCLAGGMLGPLPEKGQRMLDIAVQHTDRLIRLINDVLDLERLESGEITLAKEGCNLAVLMTQAGDVMQAMADKAGVTLLVTPAEDQLWADPERLLQALTHVLRQAIHMSPPGATVWLEAEHRGREVVLQVKDEGPGLPCDQLESVFERFPQVAAADRRDAGEPGLGLAICRRIIQQHGGRMWVESALGTGSTFFCALPALSEEELRRIPKRLASPLVLVCDHNPAVRAMAQARLAQLGYRARSVATGEAVLECATTQQPAAILFNLDTLALEAWKIILTLKEQPETQDTPIILFSPSTSEDALLGTDGTSWACTLENTSLSRALEHALSSQPDIARVLVVEDDFNLAQRLNVLFERHGIRTFHVQSGPEAIELILRIQPHLLVLDPMTPDGAGFTVVDWLRHYHSLAQMPLVVYSARELDAIDQQRLQLGYTQFLTKSAIAPKECVQRVASLLQHLMPPQHLAA